MNNIFIYLFSFFLGFGLFDPLGTNGLYFDVLTILVIIFIFYKNGQKVIFKNFNKEVGLLLGIALCLFISAFIYGISFNDKIPINFKFISAIIIFWFFSIEFSKSSKFTNICLLLFAISCGFISLAYTSGLLVNYFEILNGRLRIFGENPNSISSRMAIAFIILFYNFLFNPLKLIVVKYISPLFLPSLVYFIVDTGSRGSLLILVLAIITLVVLSDTKTTTKLFLSLASFIAIFLVYLNLQDSAIMQRFQNEGLTDSRDDLWANALTIFSDNLLIGVGEEGYWIEAHKISDRVLDTHNLFIYFLVTGGIITTTIFLIFLYILAMKCYKQLKLKDSLPMIIFVFFIFLMSKTGGIITYLIMWYFLAYINSFNHKIRFSFK